MDYPATVLAVAIAPGVLARGPWDPGQVDVEWLSQPFEPEQGAIDAADVALQALRDRGSPSHDGLAARLVEFEEREGRLALKLQPARWALRLNQSDASQSLAILCLVRDAEGRWLAGRRAAWLASWPGRWALGAGGSVELEENPVQTLTRELDEEWSVQPRRLSIEMLVCLPSKVVLFVGMARLAEGATVVPDSEHDEFTWWPADVADWPGEADEPLRLMAAMLSEA
jgi:8-oxo-dGTP diphosphatase